MPTRPPAITLSITQAAVAAVDDGVAAPGHPPDVTRDGYRADWFCYVGCWERT